MPVISQLMLQLRDFMASVLLFKSPERRISQHRSVRARQVMPEHQACGLLLGTSKPKATGWKMFQNFQSLCLLYFGCLIKEKCKHELQEGRDLTPFWRSEEATALKIEVTAWILHRQDSFPKGCLTPSHKTQACWTYLEGQKPLPLRESPKHQHQQRSHQQSEGAGTRHGAWSTHGKIFIPALCSILHRVTLSCTVWGEYFYWKKSRQ